MEGRTEPYFSRWMNKLTADGLHKKADIAEVLAKQDLEIKRLREVLEDISELDPTADETGISAVHMADNALNQSSPNRSEGKEQ